ncbi:MAG: tetratricopeptide repeat protein [Bryobacteraceae bacterium]|nr:tetratricopeptide repeat protein [Bryobacteraceae bacterium]
MASLVGRSFCGYDIVEQLGAGGMGVVYRALDRKLDRSVAIKVLPQTASEAGALARSRFLREARSASALDHPNVGTIYGAEALEDGSLCIVMACYEGGSLADRLRHGKLAEAEAVRIATGIADGLAAAHASGIIHRDVKPSNVVFTKAGLAKVVDFGLARRTDGSETLTESHTIVGTAAYMSPEQARGLELDGRTDVWSLGVVLYQMLSGRTPFARPDVAAQLYAVVHEDPPPLAVSSPDLLRAVTKAMAKKPEERFTSMSAFAAELRRITADRAHLSDLETQPITPSGSDFTLRRPRTRKILAIAACLTLAVALGATALNPALRETATSFWPRGPVQHITLAIMPFGSSETELTGLAGGLSHAVNARFSQLDALRDTFSVLPVGEPVGRKTADSNDAFRSLGATIVITGDLRRKDKDLLRLELQIRQKSGVAPASIQIDGKKQDPASLEDRAITEIARVLEIRTDSHVLDQLRRKGPAAAHAYEPYLRAVGYLERHDVKGNLEQAIEDFGQTLLLDPKFAMARVGLSRASRTRYLKDRDQSNLQHAQNYALQALELDPSLAEAHVSLGLVYKETNRRDLAVLEFQKALQSEPRNINALMGIADSYEALGRLSEAEATYKRAVALRPHLWNPINNLARFYMRQKQYPEADREFRRALELTPDNSGLHSNLGVALTRQRRLPEAVRAFESSLALNPTYPALVNLGNLHYQQRNFRQAAEMYGKALQLNSNDFRVWGSRGQALRHSGAPGEEVGQALRRAIDLGQNSLKTDTGDTYSLPLLSVYHATLGERAQAASYLQRALTNVNVPASALAYCAIAYELLGNRDRSVKLIRQALDSGYTWDELRGDAELQGVIQSAAIRPPG